MVADQRAPVKGDFIDDLGSYNPHTDAFQVNSDKVQEWLAKGVQPSNTVHNLLVTHGIITGDKVTSWRPKKKEAESKDTGKEVESDKADAEANGEAENNKEDIEAKEEKSDKPEGK